MKAVDSRGLPAHPQRRRAAPARRWLAALSAPWLAALVALLVAACGPGLGGTGTGATGTGAADDSLSSFSAQPAPVCESDFADLLACAGGGTASPAPTGSSRWFAESEPASRVLLEIAGSQARLQLRCAALEFNGTWGQAAGQNPRFYGRISTPAGEARAMLLVSRSNDGLALQLLGADGQVLHGNLALRPVAEATRAADCP